MCRSRQPAPGVGAARRRRRSRLLAPSRRRAPAAAAEPEAVDLLLEVEKLDWLGRHVDAANAGRTCLYLTSCCAYLPEADDMAVLRTAYGIHLDRKKYPDAMRLALKMNDKARRPARRWPAPRRRPSRRQQSSLRRWRRRWSFAIDAGCLPGGSPENVVHRFGWVA